MRRPKIAKNCFLIVTECVLCFAGKLYSSDHLYTCTMSNGRYKCTYASPLIKHNVNWSCELLFLDCNHAAEHVVYACVRCWKERQFFKSTFQTKANSNIRNKTERRTTVIETGIHMCLQCKLYKAAQRTKFNSCSCFLKHSFVLIRALYSTISNN